ncbi:7001_t:CDS:2 [Entrophospora sp. SA101]|nr:7001_t:CDS:2 [Entrophospora sp. SA101]
MPNDPHTNRGSQEQVESNVTAVIPPTANPQSLFNSSFINITNNDQANPVADKGDVAKEEEAIKEELSRESSETNIDISKSTLTLRALVSTKEAGVIIGKAGKNVAELREVTGVKAGVTKVVQGVQDRVLSVVGTLEGVAKNPVNASPNSTPITPPPNAYTSVRLLISHNLMGTIIGRQGLKIKHIQDVSSARMVASKEMLPQSTERVVEVQGTVEAIRLAVWEIGRCLIEDNERGIGTVLYNPAIRVTSTYPPIRRNDYTTRTGNGCIIGKGGSKISEIRRLSGSRISIAKTPHDETGERMFTIQGSAESNEKALFLLYNQLENEKERRLNAAINGGDSDA